MRRRSERHGTARIERDSFVGRDAGDDTRLGEGQAGARPGLDIRRHRPNMARHYKGLIRIDRLLRRFRTAAGKAMIENRARLTRRAFFCNALAGESDYNISVNCDMTVSCNCQDDGGAGIIGDLAKDELAAIFEGPTASRFRRVLAQGRLPIDTCAVCGELRGSSREEADLLARQFHVPNRGIMVENTVACNLECVGCERSRVLGARSKIRLEREDIARISETIQACNIKTVHYFKYGEPFVSPSILDELQAIRAGNPAVRIVLSTNGQALDTGAQRDAAMLADIIFCSVDGSSNDVLGRYQRGGTFDRAYANMKDLVEYRNNAGSTAPYIEWKYVLFNWNDRRKEIERAVRLAEEAGVDAIAFWPTTVPYHGMSWRYRLGMYCARVGEKSGKGREIRFGPDQHTA